MFCPNCGNSLSINSTSCNNCGNQVNSSTDNTIQQVNTQFQQPIQNTVQPMTQQFPIYNQTNNKKSKLNKNSIAIIIISVIILAGIIFGLTKILKKSSEEQAILAYFDTNKPIRVELDDLYGYVSSNGKMIAEPAYEYASEFYGDYAIVLLPKDGNGNQYYAVINKKGKVALNSESEYKSSIEYISDENIWIINDRLYDKNLKLITSIDISVDYIGNGYLEYRNKTTYEVGIMTSTGKATYTYKQDNGKYVYLDASISNKYHDDLKEDYCIINIDNNLYGIVNCKTGKVVYDFTEKYITSGTDNIFSILNKSTYETLEIIYIQNDKILYTVDSTKSLSYFGNGILQIRDNYYTYTYYDINNKKELSTAPSNDDLENVIDTLDKLEIFSCDDGYGIKINKEIVISCEWDYIYPISNPLYGYGELKGKKLVLTSKDYKISLYDMKAKKVITTFNTSSIYGNNGTSVFIYYKDKDTKKTIVYNIINGKQKEFEEDITISNNSNYFKATKDDVVEYYNTNFKLVYTGN